MQHDKHNPDAKMAKLSLKLEKLMEKATQILGEEEVEPSDGNQCWEKLIAGNKLFHEGNLLSYISNIGREILPSVRQLTSKGQHPYVTIICCSDSRCSPELIFTEGIGLVFVVRVAGNVVDKTSLGSVEYGIEHCKTKLLLVMGHKNCGAVQASLAESRKRQRGEEITPSPFKESIHSILNKIQPITDKAVELFADDESALNWAIEENIRNTKRTVIENSIIVQNCIGEGTLSVRLAKYDIIGGLVSEVSESC